MSTPQKPTQSQQGTVVKPKPRAYNSYPGVKSTRQSGSVGGRK